MVDCPIRQHKADGRTGAEASTAGFVQRQVNGVGLLPACLRASLDAGFARDSRHSLSTEFFVIRDVIHCWHSYLDVTPFSGMYQLQLKDIAAAHTPVASLHSPAGEQ